MDKQKFILWLESMKEICNSPEQFPRWHSYNGILSMVKRGEFDEQTQEKEPTPINWIEAQKAYSANGHKPVVLHDGLYEVEIRRSYDKQDSAIDKEPTTTRCAECASWEETRKKSLEYCRLHHEVKCFKPKNYCPNCGRKLEDK